MAQINLLPWRAALREQRKKEFWAIIGLVLAAAVVLSGFIWAIFDHALSAQQQANQHITDENAKLDSQLKSLDGLQARRDDIVARMKVIQDLQGQRPVVVRIFDELPRLTPAHVFLTSFIRKGDKFTIEGRAQSPNDVSEFLRNLEASSWFRNAFMNSFTGLDPAKAAPVSGAVAPRPEDSYGSFIISVDLKLPDAAPVTAKGAAVPGAKVAAANGVQGAGS